MTESIFFVLIGKIVFYYLIFYILIKILKGFYTNYLANALGFGVIWKPSANTWAIVTGATDGIGLEYANQLAKMGYSLLIISRNEQKLQNTRTHILAKYPKCCSVRTLAVDFTESNIYASIESEINDLEVIDVLVNNVGMSFKIGEYFTRITDLDQFIQSLINCNMTSMTKMIDLVLHKMVSKKRGVIINVSSLSAAYPIPLLSMYSASKVYCDYLSRALHYEYSDKGIIIQSVLPSFVSTNMTRLKPSLMVPTAQQFVKQALKTVGIESRTYGYWSHKLMGFFHDCVIANTIGAKYNSILVFNKLKTIRAKYYHKFGLKDNF